MQAAMRELQMHKHLIPEHQLKAVGIEASASDDSAPPFAK